MALPSVLATIATTLDTCFPGAWRVLTTEEMQAAPLHSFQVGWRLDGISEKVRAVGVNYLLLAIDTAFPNSQLRIFAPDMGSDYRWPHIESHGALCLGQTLITASIPERVRTHLHDALKLLNATESQRIAEFQREFSSYWTRQACHSNKFPNVLSLLTPGGASRQIVYYFDNPRSRILVADTKDQARAWLKNTGLAINDRSLLSGSLACLPTPWCPDNFPQTVGDIIQAAPEETWRDILSLHRKSLFMFEARTPTGPVFAAVLVNGPKDDKIKNGFRSWDRIPIDHIKRAMAAQKVARLVVNRVDAAWVHGRDHSSDLATLRTCKVAIIGCGAIGSELAALLAKAGVGSLMLVDHDSLHSANMGRHLLGIHYLGWNKAQGVVTELQRRLPHLSSTCHPEKFERLRPDEREKLAGMDMIVTAGLDIEGEGAVNAWRQTLMYPPAYLSTWVEAYALAGHAVLLYGKDDLMSGFEDEHATFRLTDWPEGASPLIVEAGCGNVFQPHGAIDLQPTIAMTARLTLDALLRREPNSCRRVWFGDREAVTKMGGIARANFVEAHAMRQFSW